MKKIAEWLEVDRKLAFKKYSRRVDQVDFKLPDGSISDFYIKVEGPTACVLALTEQGEIILVKQFRPGPKTILSEMPGGYLDPNEDPLSAARREFIEETGYDGDFEFVSSCLDDAYSTMLRYCYVAKNCKKVREPKQSQSESTEVTILTIEEFRNHLRSGRLTDIEVGYLCLDYLGLLNND